MKELTESLWNDYNNVKDLIAVVDKSDKELNERLYKERDDIRNELIRLELGKNEKEVKKGEIDAEIERDKAKNRIEITIFGISTIVGLYAMLKTFKFDQEGAITSTLGKNILNSLSSKMFKR